MLAMILCWPLGSQPTTAIKPGDSLTGRRLIPPDSRMAFHNEKPSVSVRRHVIRSSLPINSASRTESPGDWFHPKGLPTTSKDAGFAWGSSAGTAECRRLGQRIVGSEFLGMGSQGLQRSAAFFVWAALVGTGIAGCPVSLGFLSPRTWDG